MKQIILLIAVLVFVPALAAAQKPFIITVNTAEAGQLSSDKNSFTIPVHPDYEYNYSVDWDNDGVYDTTGVDGAITHNFGEPGIYTIRITGDFPAIYFNGEGDMRKMVSVDQWGDIEWETMEEAFRSCLFMDVLAQDTPDLSRVTSVRNMFMHASSLIGTEAFEQWNVSNVENMVNMFWGAESFNQNIGGWDVSAATNLFGMFGNATSFDQDLNEWDVSNVKIMESLFYGAKSFEGDISNWNVSSVENMDGMFLGANSFNSDISNWNVSSVTDMGYMFQSAWLFNRDIGGWDVSNVTEMSSMFLEATLFNQDLSYWCVGEIYSEPHYFAEDSALLPEYYPVWGTCPEGGPVSNERLAADGPDEFTLEQNYPNPFNPSTNIRFGLKESAHVQLTVYNMLGQKVAELHNGRMAAGWHTVTFNAANLASGFYLYRLQAGDFVSARRFTLIK